MFRRDQNGLYVFFGLKVEGGGIEHFALDHSGLGNLINFLRAIAGEAESRRLKLDPGGAHKAVRERPSNPVRQFSIDSDITGESAAIVCTTQAGTEIVLQMPFDILEQLQGHLPGLNDEQRKRRASRAKVQ